MANSAWTTVSALVGHGITGAVSIVAVRALSVQDWGQFATAIALVTMFSMFAESGISTVALREMSAQPERAPQILSGSLRAVLLTASVAAPLVIAAALALNYPRRVEVLVLVGLPSLLLYPALGLLRSAFTARRLSVYSAIFTLVNSVTYGTLAIVLLAVGAATQGLMIATMGGYVLATIVGGLLLERKLGVLPALRIPRGRTHAVIRASVALAGIWVVNVVYDRLDVLMLSKLGPAADVAVYSVAYTAIRLTWLVPSLVTGAFFPLLTALLRENPREARASFFLLSRIFVFIGMPLSAALALGGTDLMTLLFGDRYERAGGVVAILAWTALMTFQTYLLWYGVLACHKERLVLYLQLAGLLLNAGANAVLIPRFGTQGAAIALVLSELWAVGAQAYVVHRYLFRFPLAQLLTKPLIATVLLAPVIVAASFVSSLGAAAVAAVTVPSLLLALGYVSRDEWEPLLGPLRGVARRLSRSAA